MGAEGDAHADERQMAHNFALPLASQQRGIGHAERLGEFIYISAAKMTLRVLKSPDCIQHPPFHSTKR